MTEHAESLLTLILKEQRQTNQLLLMLIEAMGEEDPDPDDEAQTYMDGTPVGYRPSTGLSGHPGEE